MVRPTTRDPSTLAALHPTQSHELHYANFRTGVRLHGSHFMTLRRVSRLPESAREYRTGDPLNLIDWKAFARTDQLILREVRDEVTARVRIGIDGGESMRWPDSTIPVLPRPPSKIEIAIRLALNLAYMHLRMGDLVELYLFDGDGNEKPNRHPAGLMRFFKPRSPADIASAFERLAVGQFSSQAILLEFHDAQAAEGGCDVAFWVGDMLSEAPAEIFSARGKRRALLHVLSSLEQAIDWIDDDTSYFDEGLRSQQRREYQGQVLRQRHNYDRHLAAWQQGLSERLKRAGGEYFKFSDASSISEYYAQLLPFMKRPMVGTGHKF